jgi:hypothetical protein
VCSAFADLNVNLKATIQQLLTGTKHDQNDMIRYLPESQLTCDSGGMPPMSMGAQAAPPHGYRQTSVLVPMDLPRYIRKIPTSVLVPMDLPRYIRKIPTSVLVPMDLPRYIRKDSTVARLNILNYSAIFSGSFHYL